MNTGLPFGNSNHNDVIRPLIQYTIQKTTKHILRLKDYIMGQSASINRKRRSPSDKNTTTDRNTSISIPECSNRDEQLNRVEDKSNNSDMITISPILALGAGCYWGTEKYIRTKFQEKFPNSIKYCAVGFMPIPGTIERIDKPNYRQVCSGSSGMHVEVLYIELNEPNKHFKELIKYFFQFHDPTTMNRQGNDNGHQYASYIFCSDEQQYAIAQQVKMNLQHAIDKKEIACYTTKIVTTQISKTMTRFTTAEVYHQQYLEKNPMGYCNHRIRFRTWPQEFDVP
jgi:peptide-methionine (S)-S-oxide reductase